MKRLQYSVSGLIVTAMTLSLSAAQGLIPLPKDAGIECFVSPNGKWTVLAETPGILTPCRLHFWRDQRPTGELDAALRLWDGILLNGGQLLGVGEQANGRLISTTMGQSRKFGEHVCVVLASFMGDYDMLGVVTRKSDPLIHSDHGATPQVHGFEYAQESAVIQLHLTDSNDAVPTGLQNPILFESTRARKLESASTSKGVLTSSNARGRHWFLPRLRMHVWLHTGQFTKGSEAIESPMVVATLISFDSGRWVLSAQLQWSVLSSGEAARANLEERATKDGGAELDIQLASRKETLSIERTPEGTWSVFSTGDGNGGKAATVPAGQTDAWHVETEMSEMHPGTPRPTGIPTGLHIDDGWVLSDGTLVALSRAAQETCVVSESGLLVRSNSLFIDNAWLMKVAQGIGTTAHSLIVPRRLDDLTYAYDEWFVDRESGALSNQMSLARADARLISVCAHSELWSYGAALHKTSFELASQWEWKTDICGIGMGWPVSSTLSPDGGAALILETDVPTDYGNKWFALLAANGADWATPFPDQEVGAGHILALGPRLLVCVEKSGGLLTVDRKSGRAMRVTNPVPEWRLLPATAWQVESGVMLVDSQWKETVLLLDRE